jgi:ketosteroid isomerase-like protein
MKFIRAIVGLLALTSSCMALAQEQIATPAAEENSPATVEETATTASSKAPTITPAPATTEQGANKEKAATATTKKERPSPSPSAAPTMKRLSPQAALKDAENRWATAIGRHDQATVESLVDRDFIGVNEKAKVGNRRALLGELKADKDTYASARNERLDVRMYGPGVGVVVGTFHAKGSSKDGKAFDRTYRFTDTWMERNGQWQCVASQEMLVSPK